MLQMLDQLCGAAASPDRLAPNRCRQYPDLNEPLIRERILRKDTFHGGR